MAVGVGDSVLHGMPYGTGEPLRPVDVLQEAGVSHLPCIGVVRLVARPVLMMQP
jgi:hypothetical protein